MKEIILDYPDFQVIKDEYMNYYYRDDTHRDVPVRIIASLVYDITSDIHDDNDCLYTLFDNVCCGEYVADEYIQFLWFTERETEG